MFKNMYYYGFGTVSIKKLDARSINGFFIWYPKKFKGYRFYYHNHNTRISESGNDKFIVNDQFNGSEKS
uniref:Retroviral polymerase SH3-like domain-containing protein n=1 Tax=Cajanus cajan TaxID=3821 RepID=A0A151T8K7_CAJCA|nr:hypothetical protein KK1_017951 [Cajanus cajan]